MLPKSHFGPSKPDNEENRPKQTELVFGDEDDNLEVEKMMSMKPAVVIPKQQTASQHSQNAGQKETEFIMCEDEDVQEAPSPKTDQQNVKTDLNKQTQGMWDNFEMTAEDFQRTIN